MIFLALNNKIDLRFFLFNKIVWVCLEFKKKSKNFQKLFSL